MSFRTALTLVLGSAALAAQADVGITLDASNYSQNFDSLTTSTTTQTFANDSTLQGWSLFTAAGAPISGYAADTGGSNAGSFRSFGASAASDRAFGGVTSGGTYFGSPASGAVAGYIALALNNQTGITMGSLVLSYTGEQWRNGGNTNAQSITVQYGFGSTFAAVSTWTAAGTGFDFVTPVTGSTAAALDGNAAANRVTGLGGVLENLNWANGDTMWLRWQYTNNIGNDHGLAIDDLSLGVLPLPVPEPAGAALLLAGLGALSLLARRRSLRG